MKVLVRFTFKQENFKPKTDQSEMVSGGVPSQHAVRREGEWLHGLLAELATRVLTKDKISIWLGLVIQLRLYGASGSSVMIYLAKVSFTEMRR